MSKNIRHVIESQQFDVDFLSSLFRRTDELKKMFNGSGKRGDLGEVLTGKMMFNVFYEPSTRTRMSFSAAAQHLGMEVVTTENARDFSSAAKGETLEDSIRVLCEYRPDVIVLRHHETGAAERAAAVSPVPIINAGDGSGQHPTQALLDLYTIQEKLKRLEGLRVVIGGDLAHGRTARSLTYLLAKYPGNEITFVSPDALRVGDDIKKHLKNTGTKYSETDDLESTFPKADVVYWTRVQKERLAEGLKIERHFVIDVPQAKLLQPHAILMHPLPRIDEITPEVDRFPQAVYFRQAGDGMFVRMALLEWAILDSSE